MSVSELIRRVDRHNRSLGIDHQRSHNAFLSVTEAVIDEDEFAKP